MSSAYRVIQHSEHPLHHARHRDDSARGRRARCRRRLARQPHRAVVQVLGQEPWLLLHQGRVQRDHVDQITEAELLLRKAPRDPYRGDAQARIHEQLAWVVPRLAVVVDHGREVGLAAQADARIAALERDLAGLESASDVECLRQALSEFGGLWAALDQAERARVLALVLSEVTVDGATGDAEPRFRGAR
jgi:hypothetical protein